MTDEEILQDTASNPSAEPPQKPPTAEVSPLEQMEKELQEYKDKYLRLLAEMENTRKRLIKEKQEMTRFAVENVIADILTPMDNLENALKCAEQMSPEVRNWALGFEMILGQFKDVLTSHGIAPFSSLGKLYDPFIHEAVETEETTEHPEGTVIQEYVRGYKNGDRTVRPARVKVAKQPKNISESSEQK